MTKRVIVILSMLLLYPITSYTQIETLITGKVANLSSIDLNIPINSLNFLDSALKNKRILFLGEAAHGDGTTIEAKTLITKYLIEHLGFKVLIFESNIFEIRKMNDILLRNQNGDYVIKEVFRFNDYYSSSAASLRKLMIENKGKCVYEGFDIVYNSWYSELLEGELVKLGIAKSVAKKYVKIIKDIHQIQTCIDCDASAISIKELEKQSEAISKILNRNSNPHARNAMQVVKSNLGLAYWIKNRPKLNSIQASNDSLNDFFIGRDRYLADNLTYLIKKHPNEKIIVSSSTFHMTKNIPGIKTMADNLDENIKKESYFLPFIAYQGTRGYETDTKSFKLKNIEPQANSIEQFFHQTKSNFAFLNLRSLAKSELGFIDSLTMRPLLTITNKLKWSNIYDGIFFIDTMKPDTMVNFSIKDDDYLHNYLYKMK